ncbi:hypothetical protein IWQ60_009985 [Tieghemiomyces parasiticus]|uniref:NmrA-like domain-containing protein n=1 Tax=Tieghemiomyces parasiticus TaxID=78921 RepID=A0A9W8DNM0_9FUNG|nr:hypothetical protein IWQ60_009985 [Tieghemiomyces parasiticus]
MATFAPAAQPSTHGRGLRLFVSTCDEQVGYTFSHALLVGPNATAIDKLFCGVSDTESQLAQELENLGAQLVLHRSGSHCSNPGQTTAKVSALETVATTTGCFDLIGTLRRCDAALLIPAHAASAQPAHLWTRLLDTTKEAGVGKVFMMSVVGAHGAPYPHLRSFTMREEAFRKAFIDDTSYPTAHGGGSVSIRIVRKTLPHENLMLYHQLIREHGTIPLPIANGMFAPVSMSDVVSGILAMLSLAGPPTRRGHGVERDDDEELVVQFTGPEALTGRMIAEYASQVLSANLTFKPMLLPEVRQFLRGNPRLHHEEVDYLIEVYQAVQHNRMASLSPELANLLGHPRLKVRQFLEHNQDQFR